MIFPIQAVLAKIEAELEAYIPDSFGNDVVSLHNAALVESSDANVQRDVVDHLIISLVNIEEESTMKNGVHFRRNPVTGNADYENPPVNLNLYLLFSANFPTNYTRSLQ